MPEQSFVIVGGGIAASRAAETLREEAYDGTLHLVAAEPHLPYERPPLSKAVLKGEDDVSSTTTHDATWWDEHDVTLHLATTVTDLGLPAHSAALSDGSSLRYDRLLLATGSRPRRLDMPGADLDGIHYLRTQDDATALAALLATGPRLVVVGAGWIGLEVAAAAAERGVEVTMLTPEPPLAGLFGADIAKVFTELHRSHGVTVMVGDAVEAFTGDGAVDGVRLAGGQMVPADAVVVGVGALPNVELADAAGLPVDDGVLVDARLRTSDPDVLAVGDAARLVHPVLGHSLRIEHWANAHDGGAFAARSMLGSDAAYDVMPFFFSDQYDLGLEYAGHVAPGADARLVVRGNPAAREFVAFWLVDGVLQAGLHVNSWDATDPIQALIRSGRTLDPAKLADPQVPLDAVHRG